MDKDTDHLYPVILLTDCCLNQDIEDVEGH